MVMAMATITTLGFEDKKKNNRHNMKNKKFDRLVAESTRRSLMEGQRIDEWGKLVNAGKNLWNGFKAAKKGAQAVQGSRAANAGYKTAQSMGFGRKATQAQLNTFKRANELGTKINKGIPLSAREAEEMRKLRTMLPTRNPLGDALNASSRLTRLQRNANRWRTGAGMGAAGLAAYGLAGDGSGAPGADMAGAGMDGANPGADMAGADMGGMYPGGGMGGMYPGGMYPGGGYGDDFYGPDPNSLYAYMGEYPYGYGYGDPYGYGYGDPYGYGYGDMYGYGYGDPYGYGYGDPYGYGYGDPYGYGYGGAYDDGGMDPMMMYYMMNGGWGF
jgi:hypothetical protein